MGCCCGRSVSVRDFDIVIVGGGSGGLSGAIFAANLGLRVALVDAHRVGGDCTWTGCVPSKALIKAASTFHAARKAARYGAKVGDELKADLKKVKADVQAAIKSVYSLEGPEELEAHGVEVMLGRAQFVDKHTLRLSAPDPGVPGEEEFRVVGETTITSDVFVVATGAHAFIPPMDGLEGVPYLTYLNVFDLEELPERLAVVGGGPIGAEMAQAFQRLGSKVTIIGSKLLPRDEPRVRSIMMKAFEEEGIRCVVGRAKRVTRQSRAGTPETKADAVTETSTPESKSTDSYVIQVVSKTGEVHNVECDKILLATGRVANVKGLGLEAAGVEHDGRLISVNSKLQTSVPHIYAVGDVASKLQFTHLAGFQGYMAVRNEFLPSSSPGMPATMPWCTFTDPEVASVGMTASEAASTPGARVVTWDNSKLDRAVADHAGDGFIDLVLGKNDVILGGTVVGPRAGELVSEISVAVRNGLTAKHLGMSIHPYPSYAFGLQLMASDVATKTFLGGRLAKHLISNMNGRGPRPGVGSRKVASAK